jgi:hypothetical protein
MVCKTAFMITAKHTILHHNPHNFWLYCRLADHADTTFLLLNKGIPEISETEQFEKTFKGEQLGDSAVVTTACPFFRLNLW